MKKQLDGLTERPKLHGMDENAIKVLVGNRVTEARDSIGITQDELAASIGTTKSSVSGWERGLHFPRIEKLVAIAGLTGKPVYWFFSGHILSQEGEILSEQEENLLTAYRRLKEDERTRIFNLILKVMFSSKELAYGDGEGSNQGGTRHD